MPEIVRGITSPLFERLALQQVDGEGGMSSISGIQASIARDLFRLLNSRSKKNLEEYLTDELSVVDFGIPDVGVLGALSGSDIEKLEKVVNIAVNRFEPRLHEVQAKVRSSVKGSHHLEVQLRAAVLLHTEQRRVDFQLSLSGISDSRSEAANAE